MWSVLQNWLVIRLFTILALFNAGIWEGYKGYTLINITSKCNRKQQGSRIQRQNKTEKQYFNIKYKQ